MPKRHYIAKKVGDRYELKDGTALGSATSAGWTVGGGLLAVCGLSRRSIPGALLTLAGGAMIYRGVTGRDPVRFIREMLSCDRPGTASETPSYQHDFRGRATQRPKDDIEEASMESFPASDPPARQSPEVAS